MILRATFTTVTACVLFQAGAHAADIGILTLAPVSLHVGSQWQWVSYVTLGIASAAQSGRDNDLTHWAHRDQVDVAAHLTKQLMASFDRARRSAIELTIARRPGDAGLPVTRDLIPERPGVALLLDLTIDYAGLYASADTTPFRPAFMVSYRWVGPGGGLVQGSRLIVYDRDLWIAIQQNGKKNPFAVTPYPPAKSYIDADPDCKFESFAKVEEGTAKLWGCFDSALGKIADQIALDIPSGKSFSGAMTSERPDNP